MKYIFKYLPCIVVLLFACNLSFGQKVIEKDTIKTKSGNLIIHFIGHGSLMFDYNGMIMHADPSSREADYSMLPKADLILITHHHGDHFDPNAIAAIQQGNTSIVLNGKSSENAPEMKGKIVLKNGESTEIKGIKIEAIPAYNLVQMRSENNPYHPKGEGNSYVVVFGEKRIYIGGDTENTPEMKSLKNIDIAFLPMNLPYTMTPEMVADAARGFRPKVLYPYHYGSTDTSIIVNLLKEEKDIEVRLRNMP